MDCGDGEGELPSNPGLNSFAPAHFILQQAVVKCGFCNKSHLVRVGGQEMTNSCYLIRGMPLRKAMDRRLGVNKRDWCGFNGRSE